MLPRIARQQPFPRATPIPTARCHTTDHIRWLQPISRILNWFSILDEEPGVVEIEVDLRVGGKQTAVWGPNRDELFHETQVFKIIDRPHRLVTTSTGRAPNGAELTTEVEVTFEAQDGGTLVTVVQSGFPDVGTRDFFQNMAWVGAFHRIEAYLVRERA